MKREIKLALYDGQRLADKFKISRPMMMYYVYRLGLHMRPKLRYHSDVELLLLCTQFDSHRQMQAATGFSRGLLVREFERRGLPWPFEKKRTLDGVHPDVVRRMYRQAGYNWRTVAKSLGVHYGTLIKYGKEHGIRAHRGTTIYPWTRRLLSYLYEDRKLGAKNIALILRKHWGTDGPTDKTVHDALKRFGFTVRTLDEAAKVRKRPRTPDGKILKDTLPEIPAEVLDNLTDEAWLAEPDGRA